MLRTQVYLQEEQVQEIDLLVALKKKPKAKVIREVLDVGLKALQKVQDSEDGLVNGWMELRKIGKNIDVSKVDKKYQNLDSSNMDEYLYGKKSKYAE